MKYSVTAAMCRLMFKKNLKKNLTNLHGTEFAKDIIKRSKIEYKHLINIVPDLGGSQNPFISQMYMACLAIAVYRVSDGKIQPEQLGGIIISVVSKSKFMKKMYAKYDPTTQEYAKLVKRYEKWTHETLEQYPTNWVIVTDDKKHDVGGYLELHHCPIFDFCTQLNCLKILPYFCKSDYIVADFMGCKLTRESTIAEGGTYCDYWYMKR